MNRLIVVVGSINVDMVVSAPRNPGVGETLTGTNFSIFTGGKGANQAAAISRLGHPVHFIGKVGTDIFADKPLRELEQIGVNLNAVDRVNGPTGMASILTTTNGDNTIIVVPGANEHLLPKDLRNHQDLIRRAGMVLTQLETPLETLQALADLCEQFGTPLMLDPAPAQQLPSTLLRRITWFTPNETEAEILSGISPGDYSEKNLREMAEHFLALGLRNVLIKLGARGAYLATEDGIRQRIPPILVQARDTTAAGDAFNGGFAVALMNGHSPVEAARFASAVAALSVTRHGALPSMPTLDEVEQLLGDTMVATQNA